MSDGIHSVMLFCIHNRMDTVELDVRRKLQGQELCDFHSLPNVSRVSESGRMGWAGHVACMGEYIKGWVKKSEGNGLLGKN